MKDTEPHPIVDVNNTEIAFSHKSNKQLKKTAWLFELMNKNQLVNIGSTLGLWAIKWNLPFAKYAVKKTVFEQFCGGESLLDCQADIDTLYKYNVLTVLDFGAEGKSDEASFEHVKEEVIKAVEFAASNNSVPVVVTKLSGMVENKILVNLQKNGSLTASEQVRFDHLMERLHEICERASELSVGLFIDAEESWMQDTIDMIADDLMSRYNKEKVIVYNTYQMYRHDRLVFLKKSFEKATEGQYLLGAKIVRGAYMDKERERAAEENRPSPIQATKADTDRDYDLALKFCFDHYERIASCCATHNVKSCLYYAELIHQAGIEKDHPHLNFSQLFGMSDFITFNLGDAGYNVAKYLPYGLIEDVIPYLIRRAQENSSISGEMSRELQFVKKEMTRRGI